MNQPSLVEKGEAIQKLLGEHADQSRAETAELVLLDKFVQVDAEQLEDEAKMLSVDKGVFQSEKMVVIVFVELRIELFFISNQRKLIIIEWRGKSYQVEHRHLHHTLVEVGGAVFDNLDGHDLLRLEILTLDDLTKGTLAQHIENEIAIPTTKLDNIL